jgi:FAD/FMN-containing dehydrogenase
MQRRAFLRTTTLAAMAAAFPGGRYLSAAELPDSVVPTTLDAVKGAGGHFSVAGGEIKDFAKTLRGALLLPQSEGYEKARHIRNPAIDKHPAMIVVPTGVVDIQAAVNFARAHDMLVAVKCGGHSFSGQSTCDGGMMIDLSGLSGVRVDPAAKKAWVAGGSLLGLVDREAQAHDLVTTMGTVSHTGVGGLVTGGGVGRLARRFGMSIDNVLSVDMVTADGKFVHASATENPDLFWAVRGGGGNFGIVTSFEFQLHPMQRKVVNARISYGPEKAMDALKLFAAYSVQGPPEMDLNMVYSPKGATFVMCYSGDAKNTDKVIEPIRKLGKSVSEDITVMDYVDVQSSGDQKETSADPRMAMGQYLKARFIPGIGADLMKALADQVPKRSLSVVFATGCGKPGVKATETAFPHRYAAHNMLCGTSWKMSDDAKGSMNNVRDFWKEVEPYLGGGGFYFNDANTETVMDNSNYRENYPRLVELKNKYDPGNLFRLNANIVPTVKS